MSSCVEPVCILPRFFQQAYQWCRPLRHDWRPCSKVVRVSPRWPTWTKRTPSFFCTSAFISHRAYRCDVRHQKILLDQSGIRTHISVVNARLLRELLKVRHLGARVDLGIIKERCISGSTYTRRARASLPVSVQSTGLVVPAALRAVHTYAMPPRSRHFAA